MKQIEPTGVATNRLEQSVFVKSENVRIFKYADTALAVELDSGRRSLFTPWKKAVYMACNGLDNCVQIIEKLGLDFKCGCELLEDLLQSGFIKVAGVSGSKSDIRASSTYLDPMEFCFSSRVTFDAAELSEYCSDDEQKKWFDRGWAQLDKFASTDLSAQRTKPLFYLKNIVWGKHGQFIDSLLEQWQQSCSCEQIKNEFRSDTALFSIVLDSKELPKGADFVNYCQGCASSSRLCTWDRLSTLGKLWCRLHILNAEIIWRFPFSKLLEKEASAFSGCFREKPIIAPRLDEAAEVATMLFDTARKNFGLSEGHCGYFPMVGISVLPVVYIEETEQLEKIWSLFVQSGCSAFGFSLADWLLEANSAELDNALLKGLELSMTDYKLNKNLTIFPFTRWLQDLRGEIPRSESMQIVLQNCQGRSWLKNKCRRCPNWHFCAYSEPKPSLPCRFISAWASQVMLRMALKDVQL